MTTATKTEAPVFARRIQSNHRMGFLPRHFTPRHMLAVEMGVYAFADDLLEGYSGGMWEYAEATCNKAPFLIPPAGPLPNPTKADQGGWWRFGGQSSCWEGSVSREAAGIILTLFSVTRAWNRDPSSVPLETAYERLRDAACKHPEAASIFAAID